MSVDATIRAAMRIRGQASYRASSGVRNSMPFGDDVALRRILTARGRTGQSGAWNPPVLKAAQTGLPSPNEPSSHQHPHAHPSGLVGLAASAGREGRRSSRGGAAGLRSPIRTREFGSTDL